MSPQTSGRRAKSVTGGGKTSAAKSRSGARAKTGRSRDAEPEWGPGKLAQALDGSIQAWEELGKVTPSDSARVAQLRSIAASLDRNPDNAMMQREFRAALDGFRDDGDDTGQLD